MGKITLKNVELNRVELFRALLRGKANIVITYEGK
jgi:hypothetical protein